MRIITVLLILTGFTVDVLGSEPCHSDKTDVACWVKVDVPADVIVFINDYRTRSTGSRRRYYTAGLTPGNTYRYRLRFEHAAGGQTASRTATVRLRAGETANVSYDSAQPDQSITRKPNTEPSAAGRSRLDLSDPFALPPSRAKDLIETAQELGKFATFVESAKTTALLEQLGPGPFTILAPTDDAFAALPVTIRDLLKGDPRLRKDVLLYHVIVGKLSAQEAARRGAAKTVLGADIVFATTDTGTQVNGVPVVESDIHCTNGVIHVIDRVLLPPDFEDRQIR